ncbi:S10 family peptidase [Nitrosomonas communis]|uniref:S10 family peptidase n=1 Tax=Nitrosomonas communis TaxID=44574 RepID=UPI00147F9AF2|nr:peptidase S10 [Nitrosomonas communis]
MIKKFVQDARIIGILVTIWLCLPQVAIGTDVPEKAQVQAKPVNESEALDPSNRSITSHTFQAGDAKFNYKATAASITVYDKPSKPMGQIFYIAYTMEQQGGRSRPLTFVFNGGPGAASAYLHLGALGPQRVMFNADGTVPPMPAQIVDNPKSWLAFTDLVFVDPVGTGYSRELRYDKSSKREGEDKWKSESSGHTYPRAKAWGIEEDTVSLSRFIRAYLTEENRWLSPVYLIGESYGGFRVARLSRRLQSQFSIVPTGLILISPVLDFSFIWGNERSLWPWLSLLPSYAAVAAVHERSNKISYRARDPRSSLAEVERAALTDYLGGLAAGSFEQDWLKQISKLIGLDKDILLREMGRVPPARFAKALLAEQRRVLSLYDGSITLVDPEPAKSLITGSDFYLQRLNAPLTAAFNHYVRDRLNFKTDIPFLLLNEEVYQSWNWRSGIRGQQGFAEALSDLKKAMSLNPAMRMQIMHGVFDLVTPYYATEMIIKQLALEPMMNHNIQLKVYHGGHMPYLHQKTLDSMFEDALQFYKLTP